MKYRLGFVANSSSATFICDVCGREESFTMDSDALFTFAVLCGSNHKHVICSKHYYDYELCGNKPITLVSLFFGIISQEDCPLCSYKKDPQRFAWFKECEGFNYGKGKKKRLGGVFED